MNSCNRCTTAVLACDGCLPLLLRGSPATFNDAQGWLRGWYAYTLAREITSRLPLSRRVVLFLFYHNKLVSRVLLLVWNRVQKFVKLLIWAGDRQHRDRNLRHPACVRVARRAKRNTENQPKKSHRAAVALCCLWILWQRRAAAVTPGVVQ